MLIYFDANFRTKIGFSCGGEVFYCVGQRVTEKGFTSVMPWLAVNETGLPEFTKGEKIEVSKFELHEVVSLPTYRLLVHSSLCCFHFPKQCLIYLCWVS